MKTLSKFFVTGFLLIMMGCGGGTTALCEFFFSAITNGPSGDQANSFWSCQDSEGTYDLAFFDDGAGLATTLGAFTWQETGCGQAMAQTVEGEVTASNFSGSSESQVLTFQLDFKDTGIRTDNSCFHVALEEETSGDDQQPQQPANGDPSGPGNDEDIIDDPGTIGTIFFIFAQDNQFLGFVNDNPFDSDSVCNRFGNYGSKFSPTSIWNKFGTYGNDFGSLSAFNDLGSTPPVLFDEIGALAYVSTNSLLTPRVDSFYLLGLLRAFGCDVER